MPDPESDGAEPAGNGKPAEAMVPAWFPVAGVVFGGLTLIFFMALVFFGGQVRLDDQTRFFAIAVFGLGTALSVSFLGGSAAASGKLPLPFAQNHPVEFSAAGGVATLVIACVLANLLFPAGASARDEAGRGPSTGSVSGTGGVPSDNGSGDGGAAPNPSPPVAAVPSESCFYFNNGSFTFVATTQEVRDRQLAYVRNLIAGYGDITVQGFGDEDTERSYALALSERRADNVKSFLVANGVDARRIATLSFGKDPMMERLPTDAFAAAYCRVQVVPGKPS